MRSALHIVVIVEAPKHTVRLRRARASTASSCKEATAARTIPAYTVLCLVDLSDDFRALLPAVFCGSGNLIHTTDSDRTGALAVLASGIQRSTKVVVDLTPCVLHFKTSDTWTRTDTVLQDTWPKVDKRGRRNCIDWTVEHSRKVPLYVHFKPALEFEARCLPSQHTSGTSRSRLKTSSRTCSSRSPQRS